MASALSHLFCALFWWELRSLIMQKIEPLAFHSRTINSAQKSWQVLHSHKELEVWSVVEKLWKSSETICFDKRLLCTTKMSFFANLPHDRIIRWRHLLQEHEAGHAHIMGKADVCADVLAGFDKEEEDIHIPEGKLSVTWLTWVDHHKGLDEPPIHVALQVWLMAHNAKRGFIRCRDKPGSMNKLPCKGQTPLAGIFLSSSVWFDENMTVWIATEKIKPMHSTQPWQWWWNDSQCSKKGHDHHFHNETIWMSDLVRKQTTDCDSGTCVHASGWHCLEWSGVALV